MGLFWKGEVYGETYLSVMLNWLLKSGRTQWSTFSLPEGESEGYCCRTHLVYFTQDNVYSSPVCCGLRSNMQDKPWYSHQTQHTVSITTLLYMPLIGCTLCVFISTRDTLMYWCPQKRWTYSQKWVCVIVWPKGGLACCWYALVLLFV